ncbi:tyrosine-type recombinase/integrase [Hungatella hathewayi]|uniref:tyrosine-type recombinase/integrase n=1 Tax=Hungatella hathewayi TaxID=154046 RepID=UPI003568D467
MALFPYLSTYMGHISEYTKIQEIAREADPKKDELEYLTIEQTKMVLSQPDTQKKTEMRDKYFLSLLYDSGCWDQEILDLTVGDFIEMRGTAELHIIGKGQKYRATPISKNVQKLFHEYCMIYHPVPKKHAFLFYTVHHGVVSRMSADNVARFMNKYEELAKVFDADIPHLHPHLFRHTRAVHLYTEGLPLPLVSE